MGSLLDLALPCRSSATLAKSGDPPRRASEGLPPGRVRKGRSKGQGANVRQGRAVFSEVSESDRGAAHVVRGL